MIKNLYTRVFLFSVIIHFAITNASFAQSNAANASTAYTDLGAKQYSSDNQYPAKTDIKTAHEDQPDTSWKPVRRLWGLSFGDAYFDQHSPIITSTQGKESNYYEIPSNRNAFQFRRIYLGYDYDIDKRFSAEILLSAEPSANTTPSGTSSISNGDNLADNRMGFFIKLFDLRWKNVWNGTDLLMGESLTPLTVNLTEKIWGYRSIEKTIADFHRNNLYDVGVSLQGVFDPAHKNFGYDLMIANNTQAGLTTVYNPNIPVSASNPNPATGFFKIFYGDVYAKLLNQRLIFDVYADYAQTSSTLSSAAVASGSIGTQEHNMVKGFAAYTTPKITFGVEAYTQNIKNALVNTTDKAAENATVKAISVYSHGAIYKDKLGFFARYDSYNPDNDFNAADVYSATPNTSLALYNPFYKEHFVTAGLDFSPAKNIHFIPNIWYIKYTDQRDADVTAYVAGDHTLVYRLTFFFTFGK
jgi:hypothetical protein